ncbi:MAG: Ppx/GppA phosphatase family protein [Ignavibacteriales bacterium]|nr:Ppx/GppA phosphatase family protein [Ignavibacteriales bacterium]
MRLASIDIGSNTILLLIVDIAPDGAFVVVRDEQIIARLGKGVDANRRITAETFTRVLGFLQRLKATAEANGATSVVASGSSALRDARNGAEFVREVKARIGLEIEVLSGQMEAELTYRGAVSEFLRTPGAHRSYAVLDIGGGSTELTIGEEGAVLRKASLDVGAVRLTERLLKTSPPSTLAISQALTEVRSWISTLPRLLPTTRLIGVAGTVTTLAAIDLDLPVYDPKRVSGHFIRLETIEQIYEKLQTKSVVEMIRTFPQIQLGRADIILAGILVLIEALKRFGVGGITTSDRGLRYGLVLREFSIATTLKP